MVAYRAKGHRGASDVSKELHKPSWPPTALTENQCVREPTRHHGQTDLLTVESVRELEERMLRRPQV